MEWIKIKGFLYKKIILPKSLKIFLSSVAVIFFVIIAIVFAQSLIFKFNADETKNTPYMLTFKGCDDYGDVPDDKLREEIIKYDLIAMSKSKFKKYISKQRQSVKESIYSDFSDSRKKRCFELFDRVEKIIDNI